ncbi:MAG: hypothetical protein LBU14_06000 [Candidatus Peribacteria bacterium]|nr:hypothetical protein [Candidatus Peribacteria bacterium]
MEEITILFRIQNNSQSQALCQKPIFTLSSKITDFHFMSSISKPNFSAFSKFSSQITIM